MTPGYRELVISSVRPLDGRIDMSFHNCVTSLVIQHNWLRAKGVDPLDLTIGRKVLIQGKRGCEDVVLASPDPLSDFKLADQDIFKCVVCNATWTEAQLLGGLRHKVCGDACCGANVRKL